MKQKACIRSGKEYNNKISPSVVMTVQAQFDQLIHGIVTMINDTLSPNKEVTLADGSKMKILDVEKAPVGMDSDREMGEALFTRKSMARYSDWEEIQIVNEDGEIETISARIYIEKIQR